MVASSRHWLCECELPWIKCRIHQPKPKCRRFTADPKIVRRRILKRKYGEIKPYPRIDDRVYDIAKAAASKRAKLTVSAEEPEMQAYKRIKLAPGSKLALKFPHLVQDDSTTKGTVIGVGTPGASNEGSGSSGLLNNIR